MLNLSLAAVARGEVPVRAELPADHPLWAGSGLALQGPVVVNLQARTVGEGVLVRGRIRARLQLECRRCLVTLETEVDEPVDLLYEELDEEDERELSGEVYPLPQRGTELDLGPAIREQLLLRVPDFVVCDEACRGLCPKCGTDLNQASCTCPAEPEENPWDALKGIKFE